MTSSRRRRRRRIRIALVLGLILGLILVCGTRESLTLGTFNIRTFPDHGADLEAIAQAIAELDADAFAVQEIVDVAAFDRVLARASALTGRRYEAALVASHCRKTAPMELHVGVVHDARRLDRSEYGQLGDPACPLGQPAAMYATFERDDEPLLVLASTHLHAGDSSDRRALRSQQWRWLMDALPALRARLGAPVIVAGDFNSTGFLGEADPEREMIDRLIDEHDLQLPTAALPCTMYWRRAPGRFDVSVLDHVVVPEGLAAFDAEALGMCARLSCVPQEDAPTEYDAVSDHCPVRVRVGL